MGAVIYLKDDSKTFAVEKFSNKLKNPECVVEERKRLIMTFKRFLFQEKDFFLAQFARNDANKTGHLSLDKWAEIISRHSLVKTGVELKKRHILALKDYLCPCEDNSNLAKYTEMFESDTSLTSKPQVFEFLVNIFNLIDIDQSGTLSKAEAEKAVGIINKSLKTSYDTSFINLMDTNNDGLVDFEEFKNSFLKTL
jgi:Ca2+-binding EF-hand superfamily protein